VTRNTHDTILTVGYIIAGLAGALVAARLTLGSNMFQAAKQLPVFFAVGLLAALIYASARLRGVGSVILMFVLLYLSQLAMNPPIRPASAINAAVFTVPVGLAFIAASYLLKALARVPFGRFVLMGLVVALGYAVMVILFLARARQGFVFHLVLRQAVVGAELGAAIGLGFELVDLIGRACRVEGT
jgi:hypothetical protein